MKKLQHILKFAVTFVLVAVFAISTNAANISSLSQTGDWEGGTLTKSLEVTVTGDVDIKGPIIIPSGKKLIIKKQPGENTSDTKLTYARLYLSPSFTVPAGQIPCMFKVEPGGTLEIYGNDLSTGDFIAIKGSTGGEPPTPMTDGVFNESAVNAFYNDGIYKNVGRYYPDQTKTAFLYDWGKTNGAADNGAMIYVAGSLVIKDAKIASALSTDEAAAIKVPIVRNHSTGTYGTLLLEDVEIRNCYAQSGPALIIYNQVNESKGKDNTPESCSTTLKNCKLYRNYCKGAIGGIIRTGGDVVGNLILEGTTIYENYVAGYGGALVSAAQGHENTLLIMDGCRIHDNKAATYAGGVMITGGFEFRNKVTKIYNNSAATYGGAMYLVTYNGVEFTERKTLNMTFGNKLELYNNTAGNSGGGICLNMRELTSLVANSTININFEGANIHDNTAAESGGGIMLTYDNSKVNVNLNFISGTINNNTATTKDGGGVYCQIGPISGESPSPSLDVSKCKIKLNGGTFSNNKAPAGSGGGVAVKNLPIYSDEDAAGIKVFSNEALNYGAGIYVDKASFTMNSGSVYDNECKSANGEGGGIYCTNGSTFTITGGVVGGEDETSANRAYNGAGIAIANSKLSINNGVIASNVVSNFGGGIHMKNTEFEMTDGSIYRNSSTSATGQGGGIYADGSSLKIAGGVIGGENQTYANKAFNGAGVFIRNCDLRMTNGRVSYNLSQRNAGGIYVKGTSTFSFEKGSICNNQNTDGVHDGHGGGIFVLECDEFTITDGEISGNCSANNGGGIFFRSEAKNVTISGGVINNNIAEKVGGGIATAAPVTINGGQIIGNTANDSGGGVSVSGATLTINEGVVSGNKVDSRGAGVYIYSSGTCVINGGEITSNVPKDDATELSGGGVYMADGNFTMTGGTISKNQSHKGGGIYVYNCTKLDFSNGTISYNTATGHGGGIYVNTGTGIGFSDGEVSHNEAVEGGGLFADGGTITISGGDIVSNSGQRGGGIRLKGTADLTFTGGNVSNNSTDYEGGGIYTTGTPVCTFQNGNVSGNSSLIGGGICNNGGVLSFIGGNIVGNVARCGGGVFLTGSDSEMTFGNGLIRNNVAEDKSGHTLKTGYDYNVSANSLDLQGTGGGIYIQDGASLSFSGANIGIYANQAHTMADDIYSNGTNDASITLPNVATMNLAGYNSKTSELYWVEDYMKGDTGYSNGTAIAGANYSAVRYRDAIAAQTQVYKVSSGPYKGKYMALSIGHEIIYATLVRSGLLKGENAIYRVSRLDDNGTVDKTDDRWTVYSELLLFGPEDALTAEQAANKSVSKRIALYSGTWKVEETNWAWTYDNKEDAIIHEITGSSSPAEKAFVFKGTKLKEADEGYVPAERYGESVVRNDFGNGTSETDKASPASQSGFEKITDNGVSW